MMRFLTPSIVVLALNQMAKVLRERNSLEKLKAIFWQTSVEIFTDLRATTEASSDKSESWSKLE